MEDRGDNNNGTEQKSALFKLEDLQRPDGIIATAALNRNRDNAGVLAKAMTAIEENEHYRQELKTGYFTSPIKQMQMVLALNECEECGIDKTLVVDLLLAQKAGVKGGLLHDIFEALTHTTFSTNYTGNRNNNGRWWNRGDPNNGHGSQLG